LQFVTSLGRGMQQSTELEAMHNVMDNPAVKVQSNTDIR